MQVAIYSIGQPTAEEQYYVELINRARANPKSEGERLAATKSPEVTSSFRYFSVDLEQMKREFATLSAMPPLAINPKLTNCARSHSQDMFNRMFQGHTGSDGSSIGQRATRAGYNWRSVAENVYSYADSGWHGHVGFQVDWGYGSGGMQYGRGHRLNIHSGNFRELGVGVVLGANGDVGPQVVTQNFGVSSSSGAFITGVAYYDLDKDGFYSPGEGIGGLTVTASGVSTKALTANSGGYAIPVPVTAATRRVAFSGRGLSFAANAVISGGRNAKVDFTPVYSPPKLSGPSLTSVGSNATYAFSAIPGASAHDWRWVRELPAGVDAAESLNRGAVDSSGGYSMLSQSVKFSGAAAYRFAHPEFNRNEIFTYNCEFLPSTGAAVSFRSRLGWATKTQYAKVQVSTDGGLNWLDVFSQAGTGSGGETDFQLRQASLSAYAGKPIRLRFNYTMDTGSSVYYQTADGFGWMVDDVAFSRIGELSKPTISRAKTNSLLFQPKVDGIYHLSLRPVISGKLFPFGPQLKVVAQK
jgi:hypothetical protein